VKVQHGHTVWLQNVRTTTWRGVRPWRRPGATDDLRKRKVHEPSAAAGRTAHFLVGIHEAGVPAPHRLGEYRPNVAYVV
jgi:hypothetical protein